MKRDVLILLAVLMHTSHAQVFQWADVKPLNLTTNPDFLQYTMTLDTADRPAYARLLRSKQVYGSIYLGDYVVDRVYENGTLQVTDTLFGKVIVRGLSVDQNNNLYVAGIFRDTVRIDTAMRTIPSASSPNCFLLKLRSDGTLIWLRNLTLANPTWLDISCSKTDDSGNTWLGISTSVLATLVVKLDGNGNSLATFQQTNVRVISGLDVDASGNVWVSGSTFDGSQSFNGLVVSPPFTYNMYIVRYSAAGAAAWVRFARDITLQHPQVVASGTGAIMAGSLMDSTSFGQFRAHRPQWVYEFFVTKIDSAGSFLWLSQIPQGTGQGDASVGSGQFLGVASDGSILVGGFTRMTINWGNGIVTQSRSYKDLLVLSYSANGALQWAKTAGGTNGNNRGDAVAADGNGNVYLAGMVGTNPTFDSLQYSGTNLNSFLARIRPGSPTSVANSTVPCEFALEQNYPNPFNPSTTIRFSLPVTDSPFPVSLHIRDLLGRKVASLVNATIESGVHTVTWNAEGLASGVYFYQLKAGGLTATRKLILLR